MAGWPSHFGRRRSAKALRVGRRVGWRNQQGSSDGDAERHGVGAPPPRPSPPSGQKLLYKAIMGVPRYAMGSSSVRPARDRSLRWVRCRDSETTMWAAAQVTAISSASRGVAPWRSHEGSTWGGRDSNSRPRDYEIKLPTLHHLHGPGPSSENGSRHLTPLPHCPPTSCGLDADRSRSGGGQSADPCLTKIKTGVGLRRRLWLACSSCRLPSVSDRIRPLAWLYGWLYSRALARGHELGHRT
jgi:hypothetical protein